MVSILSTVYAAKVNASPAGLLRCTMMVQCEVKMLKWYIVHTVVVACC